MITLSGCEDCRSAEMLLKNASEKSGVQIEVRHLDYLSDESIDLSIKHNFSVIPSIVIEDIPIEGPKFDIGKLESLLLKVSKNESRTS